MADEPLAQSARWPNANWTSAIARIVCGAGYAVVFFSPSEKRGDGAPSGAAIVVLHAPLPMRGASRRAIAASLRRRAALPATASPRLRRSGPAPFGQPRLGAWGGPGGPAVSELLAAGHSARGRSPGTAREREERSSPARGRRIRSRFY